MTQKFKVLCGNIAEVEKELNMLAIDYSVFISSASSTNDLTTVIVELFIKTNL